jgi:hypothetical protein
VKPNSIEGKERRLALQYWIQKIAEQNLLVNSQTFQTFLLNAQKVGIHRDQTRLCAIVSWRKCMHSQEVQRAPEENVDLEIFFVNGKSHKVQILSTDQSDDVLETVCAQN